MKVSLSALFLLVQAGSIPSQAVAFSMPWRRGAATSSTVWRSKTTSSSSLPLNAFGGGSSSSSSSSSNSIQESSRPDQILAWKKILNEMAGILDEAVSQQTEFTADAIAVRNLDTMHRQYDIRIFQGP